MTFTRSEVPFAEVLAAVTELVVTGWGDGVLAADPRLSGELRERLHVDFTSRGPAGQLGRYDGRAQDRFFAQVPRALNKLAEPGGLLRKAGVGSTGPDGRVVDRNGVTFYTPAAWEAAVEEAAERRTAKQALEARWTAIGDRLGALGLPRPVYPGRTPLLSHEEWEKLLELAEGGMVRHLASDDA